MRFLMERLKRLAAEMIFYYVLNISYISTYSSWYYFQCNKFQGCAFLNGEEFYCFICQFQIDCHATEIEHLFDPKKIADTFISVKEDLKKCIDLGINPFRNYHFKFSCRIMKENSILVI